REDAQKVLAAARAQRDADRARREGRGATGQRYAAPEPPTEGEGAPEPPPEATEGAEGGSAE
ncbi:MAG TPA: hypothetical protein PLD23_10430, partial [Armatimonadota bacterium]|nr:hypothetical protein [Armatimonadota bacterium]